jgi:hypothetical protein
MWFYAEVMSPSNFLSHGERPAGFEIQRAVAATVLLVALFSVFVFGPRHDPTKVVAGVPCSVLSEEQISDVLGAPMRLMPTSGTVCQYVATTTGSRSLFVIARHDSLFPVSAMRSGTIIHGLGDGAVLADNTMYVRYGPRAYVFHIVPSTPNDTGTGEELRLATLMHRPLVAQNR